MLIVGLTGGIGSGKSTIAKIFNSLGVPVFNSDEEAKKILLTNKKVIDSLKTEFSSAFINNKLDRTKLAQLVFNDKIALNQLNKIIHPEVKIAFQHWLEKHKKAPFVIKEAAILIETGLFKDLDKLILVTAPESLRIKRVIERDKTSKQKVIQRIKNQFTDDKKIPFADFIVENDDIQMVIPQVLKIYQALSC